MLQVPSDIRSTPGITFEGRVDGNGTIRQYKDYDTCYCSYSGRRVVLCLKSDHLHLTMNYNAWVIEEKSSKIYDAMMLVNVKNVGGEHCQWCKPFPA